MNLSENMTSSDEVGSFHGKKAKRIRNEKEFDKLSLTATLVVGFTVQPTIIGNTW